MKRGVGRRVFVGSVVAGLPFLGGSAALVAQGNSGHDHALIGVDPVVHDLVRQIASTHNAAQAGPRSAHFRALAAQLRTLAVYERQIGLDDQVRAEVRRRVDREGRNAVLYAEEDLEMRRRNLEGFGFRMPNPPRQGELVPTHEQREAALDELLTNGVTPMLNRIASVAEKAALRIDARFRPTFAAQDDRRRSFCDESWQQYQQAQLLSAPFSSMVACWPLIAPVCAAMQASATTLLLVYLWDCLAHF